MRLRIEFIGIAHDFLLDAFRQVIVLRQGQRSFLNLLQCDARAGVPLQYFANRSDKVGGSTLGNLAMAQVSMNCVDIGLPQLAMHSCYETAGAEDTLSLIKLMQELYSSHFEETAFGTLSISK